MSRPISEIFRVAAKEWVEKDAAANLLEETKSAVLAQRMASLGDMPVSRAEQIVKASNEWYEHVLAIVEARKQATLKKVEVDWIKMRFSEQQSAEANARAERKL